LLEPLDVLLSVELALEPLLSYQIVSLLATLSTLYTLCIPNSILAIYIAYYIIFQNSVS